MVEGRGEERRGEGIKGEGQRGGGCCGDRCVHRHCMSAITVHGVSSNRELTMGSVLTISLPVCARPCLQWRMLCFTELFACSMYFACPCL